MDFIFLLFRILLWLDHIFLKNSFTGNSGPPLSLMAQLGVAIIILLLLCGHLEAYSEEYLKQTPQVCWVCMFSPSHQNMSIFLLQTEVSLYREWGWDMGQNEWRDTKPQTQLDLLLLPLCRSRKNGGWLWCICF